ncbi:DUF4333 domain-containing protein [Mycobacterium sp. CVI_P3]|uniref:DUF4333 domain-containing protein n=1 Tax=Mycobacterium pinniadriaticum TaxID=2994102 RepID=A0ABT3SKL5_9MYCO|nr:DUF4333 domain-containing protein [Mycobacterium pinniadriaticum]MCX2932961.1 DUF4333 domain-containing protein [Mycobacterium pinniadriaticum]MCX2939367.1 DUF4333 domain-containing protein [Mycobacterium pinniadriaticum]
MQRTMVLPRLGAALAAALAGVALAGCSFHVSTGGLSVSKTDLEKDISQRLEKAEKKPQTVTCKENLQGEVGKSTRCEVVMSSTNSFDLIVTATKVEGTTVSYDMRPAMSKDQLDKEVADLVSQRVAPNVTIDSVNCEGGLDGKKGDETQCEITAGGVTSQRTVAVTRVKGLMMYFNVLPVLDKAQVENSLLSQLAAQLGSRPDSADCTDDLEGKVGNSITCTVVAGPETQDFTVTVTDVNGDRINYDYKPAG